MRLDKLIANMGFGSRKDVKQLLKKKHVSVNGNTVKDGKAHIDPYKDVIEINKEVIRYREYIYLMMNKASGYLSATTDKFDQTVIDLLSDEYKMFNPFPVGRLDKDTEGLLLLTNDGQLAHQLTSPNKQIKKTYIAKIDCNVTEEDIKLFKQGIVLNDGYKTLPATLKVLEDDHSYLAQVVITEGKYHQVKRMFAAIGKHVIHLQRVKMGELELDKRISIGNYRELTKEELAYCFSLKK